MAYTIISQNNTTTTLSDENGNVITVPARVTLATSTDYTITKVNNNSVDLESGDGKIIRGVPACVVLAGEGGGSGGVTSVNGQTGAVVLSIPDAVQYSTMPTASADNLGDIVQFIGTTDANYTNGYFYKCVSDGQDPATYSWTQTNVQPAPSGLPDQTGQSGKFLTTDGTDASWSDKPLVNKSTNGTSILGYSTTGSKGIAIGVTNTDNWASTKASGGRSIAIGVETDGNAVTASGNSSMAIGASAQATANGAIAIGASVKATAIGAIQIGWAGTNSDAGTIKFQPYNTSTNYTLVNSDGTIPADRLIHAINKYSTMPTASASNEGWIVQFTGTTDSTYTHGYIYECKAQGTDPETYAWEAVEVQASSGGLPSQTGNAGKFLTTDGTNASWSGEIDCEALGSWFQIKTYNQGTTHLGLRIIPKGQQYGGAAINYYNNALQVSGAVCISSGNFYSSYNGGYSLGQSDYKWANVYTTKINNGANIMVPTTGGTMVVATPPSADGTYVLKATVVDGVVTTTWVAE